MNFKEMTNSNLITQSSVSRLITIVVIGLMFTVQNGHSQVFESSNTIPENVNNDVSLYNLTLVLPNFSYTLTGNSANSSNMFSIDSTGSISLARNLPETTRKLFDFEKFPVFEVYLTATNRNNITDVRSVTVRLRLSDVNDEGPVFVNQPFPYLAVVSPSASSGTIVYTLTVNDPDTVPSPKPAPQFVILTQIPIVRFKLSTDADVNKINIITTENAVFPQGVEITINVQVQDDAGNKNTADVKVLVGPRPPQFFSSAYTGQIYETNTPSFIQGKDRQQLEIKALQFQTGQSLQFKLADLSSSSSYSNFYTLEVVQSLSNTNVQTIKLKNGPAIDYETVKTMSVNVIAVDPVSQQTSTVPLSIEVLDENDNSPVFAVVQYYKVVPENLKVGDTVLTVTASDKDSGQNGVIEFATLSPNFYINTTLEGANYVGTIRVKSLLDYDKNPGAQYLFNVTATDKGNIPRTATVSVIVSVTNVNDNPPIIDIATSTYNLLETAQPNVVVAIIQSSDIDGDGVKFYFSGKIPTYEIFKIDEQSGIISLSATIPKEINSYYLPVIAVDDGKCCGPSSQSLTSSANFTVNIIDINSHKPTFSACNTYDNLASVKELSPIGTPVFKVSAVDPDRGENGRVIYQISSPNPTQANAPFEINSSNGSITVKNNFTRGSDGYIQVTVVGSNPPPTVMEGWCTFRVTIIDVNDHAPVFSQAQYNAQISISMPKNSTIIQMLATDADVGVNANLTYTFQNPSTMFSIDSLTGVVRLIGNLNGQNETFYTMVVIANDNGKDPGPKTGSTTLTINIDLEGRTPPQFIQLPPSLIFSISESAPAGTNLVTLSCNSSIAQKPEVEFQVLDTETSLESKAFGYTQIPGSNPPQMNLTLKINANLDYLTKKQYKLSIVCQTLYGITLRTFINPIVDITDANNQVPVFEGLDSTGRYAGTVAENTEAGATVIQVSASDKDEVLQYRTVTFQLLDNLDNFTIRSDGDNRATVLTRVKFDREKQEYYTVAIQAQDGANAANSDKPNTALRYINVKITDVNDNPPSFANTTYSYTVLESAEVNTRVGSVTANDPDSIDNGNLNYRFTADTNINNAFSILAGTGEIRVARKLDYESDTEPKTYNLSLIAIDSNQLHNASTTVLISVIDVNDNDPVFLQNSYEVNGVVTEEDTSVTPQNPKFLVQVHATDKDKSRPETDIRYYLMGSNTNFIVNSTSGDVYLTGPLDRDVDNPVYTFTVRAEDERVNPRLGYANVFITPMDINDNSPVFDPAFLRGNVTENLARGNFCLSVLARDKDFGENGTVKYQISNSQPSPSRASLFRIIDTSGSGLIFAIGRPDQYDHETDKLMYLSVEAYDQGRPSQKTTTATVTIYITDDNDQSPYFEQALYTTQMSEAFTSGSVLLVPAIDLDDDPRNKDLRFKLIGAPGDNFFFVSTLDQKANIQVFKPVDYETNDHVFNMTLTVEDGAEGHKNSTQVQIFITDYNDNDPVITPSFKEVLMLEERPAGTVVFKFNATDKDEGLNGQFDFTIRRSTDPRYEFYIHPQTGEVKTRKPVDREEGDTRNIIVVATDKGETPRSGSATLIVKLTDINDNAPSFKDNYTPVLDENQPFDNRLVVEIFGKDPDTLENGPPFGFKLPDNCNVPACQYFTLTYNSAGDSNRGTATVRTKVVTFDREQAKTYLLPIVMWDRKDKTTGDPSMTTTNTLTITIGDQNDNDQKPGHQNIYVYNYEGQFADVEIGRVYVEDPDDWDLPDKTFSNLRPATMQNYFSVAPDSGMITIKKNVPVGTYELQVSVYDKKYLSTVTGTVSVMVSQLSDEAVMKSGSIRLNDMTAEQFVKPSGSGTLATSTFDKFRTQLASLLGYSSPDNIDIVSLTDGKGFLDVHYSAHGSPYSNPSQIESAIMLNQNQFEQNVGVKIDQVPVNLCMDEVYDDGCYTDLGFTGTPLLVNSNGSSYVMTRTSMSAKAGCVDSIFPEPEQCRGDYCFNGGTCVLDDWKKLSCNCLPGFDGPRCQQRRHSFDGSSIAFYDTLSVCSEGRTSIEFITTQEAGVIMYTGPLLSTSQDSKDYMTLTLSAGLPTLKLNLGTDELLLSLPSNADKVNDGKWHHIDIDRDNQNVVLTLDRCEKASSSANGTVADWSPCRITGTVPGPDVLLNVQSFLQLGGQYKSTTAAGFNGCLRNLVHNTKLYDLSFKLPNWKSGTNGCPTEETVCAESSAKPVCGVNAACDSVWSPSIQINKCRCAPGWYGDNCAKDAPVVDLKQNSYLKWQASAAVIEQTVRKTSFQMMFRTRKTAGSLFMLTNAAQNQINLKLTNSRLTLVYNMGMGEKILALTNATVNNGQWHTIRMERYGTEFLLSLDGGEGRNYNYQVAIPNLSVFFKMLSFFSVGGSIQPVATAPSSIPDDLFSTCVRDIRLSDIWLPLSKAQNTESVSGLSLYDVNNVVDGCTRDDCGQVTCAPNQVCFPLWEKYECRCAPGFILDGVTCVSLCQNNPCLNGGTCTIVNNQVSCACPSGWTGNLCGAMAIVDESGLSGGAIAGIVIGCLLLLILVILLLLFLLCRRRTDEKEKFVLEVDPDDDYIRENVMFYDEEGAGEEDHDAYDLTLLQKPHVETSALPKYPDKTDEMSRRNAPRQNAQPHLDRPDVGSFIDHRIKDAEDDDPFADSTREYNHEGSNSDAGSLSSLNTSSSDASQDYDYLSGWGPKFAKLADMYGAGQNFDENH